MMLRMLFGVSGLVLLAVLASPAMGNEDTGECVSQKIDATGVYYRCLSREVADSLMGDFDENRSCEKRLDRKFRRAERHHVCPVEGDAETIAEFLAKVQFAVDDTIITGDALPPIEDPHGCDPATQDLLDFEYYANQDGYWCGDATTLGSDGNPFQINAFPHPYANYKIFIQVKVEGPELKTKTLVIYPRESFERCLEIEEAGFPTSLVPGGRCGVNGAGKVYVGNEVASDCKGGLVGVFPLGQLQFFAESKLLSERIQVYRQETEEGGALILDDVSTLQDDAWVLTGQLWNPRQAPGLPQLEGNFFDRMHKCSKREFFGQIAHWGHQFKVPRGRICGLDSGNQLTNESCFEFFRDDTAP